MQFNIKYIANKPGAVIRGLLLVPFLPSIVKKENAGMI